MKSILSILSLLLLTSHAHALKCVGTSEPSASETVNVAIYSNRYDGQAVSVVGFNGKGPLEVGMFRDTQKGELGPNMFVFKHLANSEDAQKNRVLSGEMKEIVFAHPGYGERGAPATSIQLTLNTNSLRGAMTLSQSQQDGTQVSQTYKLACRSTGE